MKRLYKDYYTFLNESARRGFINHHIAGGTKFIILIVAAYPFIDVAFRNGTLNSPYAPGSMVTMGDILVVCAQLLVGMYIFELLYRVKISPISTLHHIGAIIVTQSAIAISLDLAREPDADVEFILCTVWGESNFQHQWKEACSISLMVTFVGAFDIVCELVPHIAIILYRICPSNHLFLSRLFIFACCVTAFGTLSETIVIFYLFGSLWSQWQLAFKIVTPILHVAFSATQIHGSRIFYFMWRKQKKLLAEQRRIESEAMSERGEMPRIEVDEAVEEKKEELTVVEVRAGGVY